MNRENLGKLIRERRIELGLTLLELSLKAFVSKCHVNNIELGYRGMSESTKESIFKVLGLNLD